MVRSRVHDLEKLGVDVRCGVTVKLSDVSPDKTDVVIEATGALPADLAVSTEFPEKVFSAWAILAGQELAGKKILVIGAGMVGLEIADLLVSKGKDAVVIEMCDQVGENITPTFRAMLLARLDAEHVRIITGVALDRWGMGRAHRSAGTMGPSFVSKGSSMWLLPWALNRIVFPWRMIPPWFGKESATVRNRATCWQVFAKQLKLRWRCQRLFEVGSLAFSKSVVCRNRDGSE